MIQSRDMGPTCWLVDIQNWAGRVRMDAGTGGLGQSENSALSVSGIRLRSLEKCQNFCRNALFAE